jgi:hypothetical protein
MILLIIVYYIAVSLSVSLSLLPLQEIARMTKDAASK